MTHLPTSPAPDLVDHALTPLFACPPCAVGYSPTHYEKVQMLLSDRFMGW